MVLICLYVVHHEEINQLKSNHNLNNPTELIHFQACIIIESCILSQKRDLMKMTDRRLGIKYKISKLYPDCDDESFVSLSLSSHTLNGDWRHVYQIDFNQRINDCVTDCDIVFILIIFLTLTLSIERT